MIGHHEKGNEKVVENQHKLKCDCFSLSLSFLMSKIST